MRINHNIAALNTHRQLGAANNAQSKSMEKLSSGLRINSAADDAAGLAISEKMRAQVRGLDQATSNAQDGISMIQTAEGALGETHSILQRMRELATQASNDTNVGVDRTEIQKEMNALSSEINRIGNTTEFNTQGLLKGDGKADLETSNIADLAGKLTTGAEKTTTEAKQTLVITGAAAVAGAVEVTLNGIDLKATFTASGSNGSAANDSKGYNVTSGTADVAIAATSNTDNTAAGLRDAFQQMIDENETLKGQYKVTGSGSNVVIEAVKGGTFEGAAGNIAAPTLTTITATGNTANTGVTTQAVNATKTISLATATTDTAIKDLVGKGFTANGQQVEFYNANDGAYTGNAIGVNISDALAATTNKDQALAKTVAAQLGSQIEGVKFSNDGASANLVVTATKGGLAGNDIEIKDGGVQEDFKATFQVGANTGQSMTIEIADMRSDALGITGKAGEEGFTTTNVVNDGTNNTSKEAALDVSSHEKASAAIKVINDAIETVSAQRSNLGAFQNRLDHTINNLGTSSENLTAAESRIRDVDMAKEMMNQTKESILAQASQAMLAQANQKPQSVLQLLQ